MRLAKALVAIGLLIIVFATSANGAELLGEHVTDGTLDLPWVAGFETPNNMYGKTLDPDNPAYANPSGDHTVAVAQNASPDSGGIIVTVVDPGPVSADYVWEGRIFTGAGNTRRGLIVRATPANHFKSMYQFVIQSGLFRLSFRKLIDSAPTTLADWFATSLPAQSIAPNTWHKMKVIASGNSFRCFFDDFELTPSPIVDNSIAGGWAGCYNFRFDLGNVPAYFDDLTLSCVDEVAVDFQLTPSTLNLHSVGRWVTGVIEPTPPALASDVDVASIRVNGAVSVDPDAPVEYGDGDGDGIPEVAVKFLRTQVELTVSEGAAVPVTVSGLLAGSCFSGTDHIRVLRPKMLYPVAGEVLAGGSTVQVRWEIPVGTVAPTAALLSSLDDGATWNLVATGMSNSGVCDWVVPQSAADHARVAVVQIESADETGYQVTGVLSISDAFGINSTVSVGDGPAGFTLRGLANPSTGPLRVSFSLPRPRAATLAAYDVGGRLVASRQVEGFGAGPQAITLVERAPAGVYVVRLSQGGQSVTTRISVVR